MKRVLFMVLICSAGSAAEPTASGTFTAIFAPLKTTHASLSPDGRHLAYSFRDAHTLFLGVLDLDADALKARVIIGADERRQVIDNWYSRRPNVTGIRWISAKRLIVESGVFDVVALDYDGGQVIRLVDPKDSAWNHPRGPLAIDPAEDSLFSPATATKRRPVRVVALPAAAPGTAYLEAGGTLGIGVMSGDEEVSLFKVDTQTGRFTRVSDQSVNGRLLYDQDGQARVYTSVGEIPHRFLHRPGNSARSAWQPLDQLIGDGPPQFAISAEGLFGHRSVPLGFAFDPNVLFIASNVGRDLYGIYGLDLRTGRRTAEAVEHPEFDLINPVSPFQETSLVLDRFTQKLAGVRYRELKAVTTWVDAELASVQARIEAKLPRHSVHVLGWNESRDRFLLCCFNRADPGSHLVYFKTEDRLRSYLPAASEWSSEARVATIPWRRRLPDGRILTGNLTRLTAPRSGPIPTVVYLNSNPWGGALPDFAPEVCALAEMGFAVLEVSPRGSFGRGIQHWLAGRDGIDRAVAADIFSALDLVGPEAGLDRDAVAVVGADFGGYHALRMMQLHPARIRCVVAIDPVTDLVSWSKGRPGNNERERLGNASRGWYFGTDVKRLREQSPITHPELLTKPLMLVSTRHDPFEPGSELRNIRATLRDARPAPVFIGPDNERDGPTARARLFAAIEPFLTRFTVRK